MGFLGRDREPGWAGSSLSNKCQMCDDTPSYALRANTGGTEGTCALRADLCVSCLQKVKLFLKKGERQNGRT